MDIYQEIRNYYPVFRDNQQIAEIDRSFTDEIAVKLPCGYFQRFWVDYSDEKAIEICMVMKEYNIETS